MNCVISQPASCSNRVESGKVTVAKETQRSTRLENAEPDSAEPFGLTEEQADTDRLLRRLLGTALADRLRRFLPPEQRPASADGVTAARGPCDA
jgi:hypothetical protein